MRWSGMTDWRPDKLARRMPFLQARARIQAALRQWFADEGFVEVETPILQVAPGAEVHLQGFATDWETPDGEEEQVRWLHSSPEFAMKKLLAGGVPKLFQFARVFRNGEGSALHHPEFTMLEWYRAGAGYETIMEDCAALLGLTGARELRWEDKVCDPEATPERLTVAEAFDRYAGVDVLAHGRRCAEARAGVGHRHACRRYMGRRLLPGHVRQDRAAARHGPADHPLRIPDLDGGAGARQARRSARRRALRALCLWRRARQCLRRADRSRHPACAPGMPTWTRRSGSTACAGRSIQDFLAALDHGLPQCSGIALGFDRLVMLATGAAHIEDVLWLPVR